MILVLVATVLFGLRNRLLARVLTRLLIRATQTLTPIDVNLVRELARSMDGHLLHPRQQRRLGLNQDELRHMAGFAGTEGRAASGCKVGVGRRFAVGSAEGSAEGRGREGVGSAALWAC